MDSQLHSSLSNPASANHDPAQARLRRSEGRERQRRRHQVPRRAPLAARNQKEALHFDAWLKDAAPSTELRQWFGHDPAKWKEFQRRYFAELDKKPEAVEPIRKALRHGPVAFLYSSHDTEHNNAVALKTYLTTHHKA
jgi:uncharacterized protein YeaO (DUF488 family)